MVRNVILELVNETIELPRLNGKEPSWSTKFEALCKMIKAIPVFEVIQKTGKARPVLSSNNGEAALNFCFQCRQPAENTCASQAHYIGSVNHDKKPQKPKSLKE